MTIDPAALLQTCLENEPYSYSTRDSILYALGVGLGRDPEDARELPFVYEAEGPSTVPTMAAMLLPAGFLDNCGWDFSKVLHGGLGIELLRPLPASADLLVDRRVSQVLDRGPRIGALIDVETEVRLARDETVMFTLHNRLIARGDGGFGGARGKKTLPHRLPKRQPDLSCDIATRADQALLFRQSGDLNPLHIDGRLARQAGFDRAILHGRCTSGIACHAILKTICDYDFTLIRGFDVRFTAPVYPGDIITTDMWQDRNVVSFRCTVQQRGVTVINNGRCVLATN